MFTTTSFAKQSLIEDYGCSSDRIIVCGIGINSQIPDLRVGPRRPVRTILFAGTDWERKGGSVLLEAFEQVHAASPHVRLVVAGCRPRLRREGVLVVGPVSQERLNAWYREADVFCMPSWIEPAGVVYLEAAAYGLPVIATNVGGAPELVVDGVTGYVCPPGDSAAIVERFQELIDDPSLGPALGARGHQNVCERFTWRRVAATIANSVMRA